MPALAPSEVFLFESFRFDRRRGLSRRDDSGSFAPVEIGSRALGILGVLIEQAGETVSKDEIIAAVWPGIVVEDSNLTVQISALRRVLDRGRSSGSCIQTVSGHGYRFVVPVEHPAAEAHLGVLPVERSGEDRSGGAASTAVPSAIAFEASALRLQSGPGSLAWTRRLTAILAADVAGYSRLMGADEEGTHERLKTLNRQLVDPEVREHKGRIVKMTGDGLLVEFSSVIDAVRCALAVQTGMFDREPGLPDERRIRFRIGINLGDVIADGGDIFGDGVNVAARLEALAEPGGICISGIVRDQIRDILPLSFDDMGKQSLKNIARPVRVYALRPTTIADLRAWRAAATTPPSPPVLTPRLSIVVLPFVNLSNDPDQQYIADGITDDLTTDLSRLAEMFVISRITAFTYRDKRIDARQIGRELGVRYVLEGSVRRSDNKFLIHVQLIDAEADAHVWARRFDRDISGLSHLHGEITSAIAGAIEPKLLEFDERPAIAVMPFANPRGDPDQQHIADGLTDEIITELASWRAFPIIARGSTFCFRDQAVDVQVLSRELGARYVVEGSVSRLGRRLRIVVRLVDARTGHYLLTERYDRDPDEVFDIQDEIAETVVGSIAPEVLKVERERISRQPLRNPTSYQHFIRGLEYHYRYTKEDNAEAQKHFYKAVEADPENSQALALLAHAMIYAVQHGWREDPEHNFAVADKIAAQAVKLDGRSPFAHFALGSTSMFLGRTELALAEMQEAVRLNPSHAAAHAVMAHLLCYTGRPGEALASINRALRLSPHDPRLGLWLPALAQAHYFLEQYQDAIAAARRALTLIPGNVSAARCLAASFGQLGNSLEATPWVVLLRESREPTLAEQEQLIDRVYRDPGSIAHLLDGLRKAGMT